MLQFVGHVVTAMGLVGDVVTGMVFKANDHKIQAVRNCSCGSSRSAFRVCFRDDRTLGWESRGIVCACRAQFVTAVLCV
jgi:hypothetical protein